MIHVNMYGAKRTMPFFRQTFNASGAYRNIQFCINRPDAEWQLVGTWELESFLADETLANSPSKFIFHQAEPPDVYWPAMESLKKFHAIITPFPLDVEGPLQFIGPEVCVWNYGVSMSFEPNKGQVYSEHDTVGLEELIMATPPPKDRLCSMVVSAKAFTPGHQLRFEFLQKIMQHFADKIDFYGFGYHQINAKKDAIDPYLFSVAIENSVHNNYWTEKIADTFLGYAMPIYHGAPNIHDYFAESSMHLIDINNFDATVASIEDLLEHPEKYNFEQVVAERRKILTGYNMFNMFAVVVERLVAHS